MNKLLLLRHGKSDWDNYFSENNASDFDRPISDRGKRSAQRMGVWLAEQGLQPDIIISSPANRARTTAEKLVKAMEATTKLISFDDRLYHGSLYHGSVEAFTKVLSEQSGQNKTIMLVGHNPAMEFYVNYLSNKPVATPDNGKLFPTAALAHFNIECGWQDIEQGCALLQQIQYAKKLKKGFPFPSANNPHERRKRPAYYYQQSSVIPYRFNNHNLEILLVSSSKNHHYVVPKGIHEPGLSSQESAQKEAMEEAGVEGVVDNNFIDEYQYEKWGAKCNVSVYPMEVTKVIANDLWQESHRGRSWHSVDEACELIHQSDLKAIFKKLESKL